MQSWRLKAWYPGNQSLNGWMGSQRNGEIESGAKFGSLVCTQRKDSCQTGLQRVDSATWRSYQVSFFFFESFSFVSFVRLQNSVTRKSKLGGSAADLVGKWCDQVAKDVAKWWRASMAPENLPAWVAPCSIRCSWLWQGAQLFFRHLVQKGSHEKISRQCKKALLTVIVW